MIKAVDTLTNQFDGQYFSDAELAPISAYVKEYEARLKTYRALCQRADVLKSRVSKKMKPYLKRLSSRKQDDCTRDMDYVLRYVALAILLDNESIIYDQLLAWMQTIVRAHKKHRLSTLWYKQLQLTAQDALPNYQVAYLMPHIEVVIQAFSPPDSSS